MLKVFIVDDEKPARSELRYLLEQFPDIKVVGEAASGEEALEVISEVEPDAVFLDIHLNDLDGMDVAAQLLETQTPPFVVFASAYDEHAIRAFETEAIDYIIKPFSEARLAKTICRMRKLQVLSEDKGNVKEHNEQTIEEKIATIVQTALLDQQPKQIPVEKNGKILLIHAQDIVYVTVESRHAIIYTDKEQYGSSFTLQELETKLPVSLFYRSHRAYIVNLSKVSELVPWFNGCVQLVMQDEQKTAIPVSRSAVKEVKRRLGF